ncbi:MAG: hypothetical protein JNL38_17765, partial [Myxococcales bacterium]|nr:hypothetical protein [Myxococcales bacterium]
MRLRVLRWALPSSILLGISLSGCPDRAPARPAVAPLAPSALASVAATPADAGAPTPPAAPAPTVKKLAASPGRTCALL